MCATLGDAHGDFRLDFLSQGPAAGLRYALHFDAGLVAQYLRTYSERLGVVRLERTVADAALRADGCLDEFVFRDGSRLPSGLFIDCSGFRGVLIEQVLTTGYLDWSAVLPCDRAVAFPKANSRRTRPPYTEANARTAGWRWRIPLQHRAGNGYVYCSTYLEDQAALEDLLADGWREGAGGTALFALHRRSSAPLFWNKNCVALGLASGFLEPLESTSIHLVMSDGTSCSNTSPTTDLRAVEHRFVFRRTNRPEIERIRDFIVLHYCLTRTHRFAALGSTVAP